MRLLWFDQLIYLTNAFVSVSSWYFSSDYCHAVISMGQNCAVPNGYEPKLVWHSDRKLLFLDFRGADMCPHLFEYEDRMAVIPDAVWERDNFKVCFCFRTTTTHT